MLQLFNKNTEILTCYQYWKKKMLIKAFNAVKQKKIIQMTKNLKCTMILVQNKTNLLKKKLK